MKPWLAFVLLLPVLFAQAAEPRVVSLSWEATEHLLRLGITPLAVADADDYRVWLGEPQLPVQVPNAGLRNEPSLELLAQVRPTLIVIDSLLESLRPTLERIAPVIEYSGYAGNADNLARARANFLDLARRLGRLPLAEAQLAAQDAQLACLRDRLQQHFAGQPPPVTVIRFASPTTVFVFGANSLPRHALAQLGVPTGAQLPASPWGISQLPLSWLGQQRGVVLHVEPFPQAATLFATPLWRAMPFVRAGRFASLPPLWAYGGSYTAGRFAQAIADALLMLPRTATNPSAAVTQL